MASVAQNKMSAAEFRSSREANHLSELIRGKIVHIQRPDFQHQQATLAIASFLRQIGKKGTTCTGPTDLFLGENNVLKPDVMWVRHNNERCFLRGGFWHGAPDLIVEVLSSTTTMRDRGVKFDLYEKFSVREYWIVDTRDQYIEVYRLESGRLTRQGLFGLDDTFRSTPLSLNIEVASIFES